MITLHDFEFELGIWLHYCSSSQLKRGVKPRAPSLLFSCAEDVRRVTPFAPVRRTGHKTRYELDPERQVRNETLFHDIFVQTVDLQALALPIAGLPGNGRGNGQHPCGCCPSHIRGMSQLMCTLHQALGRHYLQTRVPTCPLAVRRGEVGCEVVWLARRCDWPRCWHASHCLHSSKLKLRVV